MEIGGHAVAISAPGGFGKTTLAAALAGRGHGLLAEDTTVIDRSGSVIPGPDLLRLRPDSIPHLGLGRLQVVHETSDRVMVRTGSSASGPVPLSAVVFLKAGDRRSVSPRRDSQRLADLWQVGFHLPNLSDRTRAFDALATVAGTVPVYDLTRPMDWDSLQWSMDTVEELVR